MKRPTVIVFAALLVAGCATGPRGTAAGQVKLPEAPPPGEPAGTTGLSEAALKAAFGTPAFVRRDGQGQIWRFDGTTCKAFFFLYSRENVTAVWHVETTPRGASIAADEACLTSLRARAASRPVS